MDASTEQITPMEAFKRSEFRTYGQLAKAIGADSSQVGRWIRGENTPGQFWAPKIARKLGSTPGELWP